MSWTKRHSQNAIAAKARRRIEMAQRPPKSYRRRVYTRRPRGRAKWRLQLRDLEHGDSLTLTLHRLPWPARYVDTDGHPHSAASLGRALTAVLRHAA